MNKSDSAVERGVLDHPFHQLFERDPRVRREFGHKRRLGHSALGGDLKTDQYPLIHAVVVTKIRTADTPTPERAMRLKSQSSDLLVNIWFKRSREDVFGPSRGIFGLKIVETYRRDDLDHVERPVAHDRTGQLLTGNELFGQD